MDLRTIGNSVSWEMLVEFLDTMSNTVQRVPSEFLDRIHIMVRLELWIYVDGYLFDEELVLLSEDGANISSIEIIQFAS